MSSLRMIAGGALACAVCAASAWPQAASSPAPLPSLLQQAAQPAQIHLDSGNLTIEATNSSLRAILDDLGKRTGTRIDGLSHDERIFGVYGPGNPQQVLAALLDDSGYNVLISGKKVDGSPREIVLSTRAAAVSATAQPAGVTQAAQESDDSDSDTPGTPPPQPALFTPPPQQPQVPAANGQQAPGAVKTPAQMLQELQQLRQSQQPAPQ